MPFHSAPANRNRELNVQQLDTSQLSTVHEWDIHAQSDMSFRHIVEENLDPRADAQRYKLIADVNIEGARASFSRACSSTTLFNIPSTIKYDRTFARDALEAYYIDAMHQYLSEPPGELRVEDIPLLKFRLHSRYFCALSRRPIHFNEQFERRRLHHWVPGDSPDLEYFSDLQKASWFPELETWFEVLSQPCALPLPLPFVIYYFHTEIRLAQRIPNLAGRFPHLGDSERLRRLRFCIQHEYYVLFLAVWWNELYYGGRAFVVKRETMDILHEHCGNVPDIAGKPAQAIIERMRMFADMPSSYHNWLCFPDRCMENSPFIFAVKNAGVHVHSISSGRRLWCRRDHRNITVSKYSRTTHRRLAVLEERLSGSDLDDVPGLLSLVRNQEWARYSSLRVCDLLQNLVGIYTDTSSKLDEARRQLNEEGKAHEVTKNSYNAVRHDLFYAELSLDDKKYQLSAANNRLDTVYRQLDKAHGELDYLQRHRNDRMLANPERDSTPRGVNTLIPEDNGMHSPHYDPEGETDMRKNPTSTTPATAPSTPAQARSTGAPPRPTDDVTPLTSGTVTSGTSREKEIRARSSSPAIGCPSTQARGEASIPATPASGEAGSPGTPRRRLRKIKPGYFFHPMPTPVRARSAQIGDTLKPTDGPQSDNVTTPSEADGRKAQAATAKGVEPN